jgi:parallel beta-helix repeat protein
MPLVDGVAIVGDHPNAIGIEAIGTMQLTLSRNHIRGVLHGIHLVGNNRNVIISDCHIYENRGIGIYYDNVNLHQSNIVVGSNCFGGYKDSKSPEIKNGIKIINSADCTFSGLHLSNVSSEPAALIFDNCRRINLTNCTILDCDNIGLLLKDVSYSRVSDCLIRDDRPDAISIPIRIIGGRENTILNIRASLKTHC